MSRMHEDSQLFCYFSGVINFVVKSFLLIRIKDPHELFNLFCWVGSVRLLRDGSGPLSNPLITPVGLFRVGEIATYPSETNGNMDFFSWDSTTS